MENVKLAYFNETYWLVAGEQHIDTILAGYERLACEIGFVTCGSWREVMELWDNSSDADMPWAIHPNIARRLMEDAGYEFEPAGAGPA